MTWNQYQEAMFAKNPGLGHPVIVIGVELVSGQHNAGIVVHDAVSRG